MSVPVTGSSLQQQHLPNNVVYATREPLWQPVVTPISLLPTATQTEVPKESIIANTDFTTTSVIAKRRLSSRKKRRQMMSDNTSTSSQLTTPTQTVPSTVVREDSAHKMPVPTSTQQTVPCALQGGVVNTTLLPHQYIPISALQNPLYQQHNQMAYGLIKQEGVASTAPTVVSAVPQQQLRYVESSTGQQLAVSPPNQLADQPHPSHMHPATAAAYQLQQQQQQQLAMLQLFGATPGILSATPMSLSDIHQLQLQGRLPMMGPAHQQHCGNQLIGVPVYAAQPHSVPIATAIAPPELLVQMQQNGSWVAAARPNATPIYSSCIVNPIQPGLMTTSLVN